MNDPITIHTDGACTGNPGPGGFAAILTTANGEDILTVTGGDPATTNNRMELSAVIEALRAINSIPDSAGSPVTVYSDSQYVVKAFTHNWLQNWQRRGWTNAKGDPVANRPLWEELLDQVNGHRHTFVWVRGHSGHPMNERCDRLAVAQAKIAPQQPAFWSSAGNPLSDVLQKDDFQEPNAPQPAPVSQINLPMSELALERNEIAVTALQTAQRHLLGGDTAQAADAVDKALRHLTAQALILRAKPQLPNVLDETPPEPHQLDMWSDRPF